MIWFTADLHFGHSNIIKYCNRPFSSIIEHDQTLIHNWNSVIQQKDEVYVLGDIIFSNSPGFSYDHFLSKLKGRIYLIKGNHDKGVDKEPLLSRFEWIKDVFMLKTQYKGKKVEIFLSHYSHQSWPKNHYGAYHAFGHSHGGLKGIGKSLDVGVDNWNYTPISLNFFIEEIDKMVDNDNIHL